MLHSAVKLEKTAISKVQKHIFCYFKNGKKINFCTRKKFKTTKNEIYKKTLFAFWKMAKNQFFAPQKSLKLPKMQF